MKSVNAGLSVILTAWTLLNSTSFAQGRTAFGKTEYDASCAGCHGLSGKGEGVLASQLAKRPSDLTTLSSRNGGVFPNQRVWEIIDGRNSVDIGAHGTREMPVWGLVYRSQDTPQQPDWTARNRMTSLLDYLTRIQEK